MTALVQRRNHLLRHREGDPAAFARLVEDYRAPIYSYLLRCGVREGDCDDLFQEIFLRIHRAAGSYRAELPLHPWLFTIVANTVRKHFRRRRLREVLLSDFGRSSEAAVPPAGERSSAARETLSWLEHQLSALPLVQREVLLLVCVENLSHADVAQMLEIPIVAVRSHLRRARTALAAKLARLDDWRRPL